MFETISYWYFVSSVSFSIGSMPNILPRGGKKGKLGRV
jgi:hypothetical protein